jgi:hypothetical protein
MNLREELPGEEDSVRDIHVRAFGDHGAPSSPCCSTNYRLRWRHLAGSSRGVGIRLVRDVPRWPVSANELACQLRAWISGLDDRFCSPGDADERLIQALASSQANAGFGTHVAAGIGEPRHG